MRAQGIGPVRGRGHHASWPPTSWSSGASGTRPEGRRIFPRLTVLENLQMGAFSRPKANIQPDIERVFDAVPAPPGAHRPARRHAVRRRAADARDRARAHGRAAPAPARRAVARPRADPRRAGLRDDQGDQRPGHHGPARRAERAPGAVDRPPRLRPADRRGRAVRLARRRCARTRWCARPTSARISPSNHGVDETASDGTGRGPAPVTDAARAASRRARRHPRDLESGRRPPAELGFPISPVRPPIADRGLSIAAAVVALVIGLAVVKPWVPAGTAAPAAPPRDGAPRGVVPTAAATPRPTDDSAAGLAGPVCLGASAWRIASLETLARPGRPRLAGGRADRRRRPGRSTRRSRPSRSSGSRSGRWAGARPRTGRSDPSARRWSRAGSSSTASRTSSSCARSSRSAGRRRSRRCTSPIAPCALGATCAPDADASASASAGRRAGWCSGTRIAAARGARSGSVPTSSSTCCRSGPPAPTPSPPELTVAGRSAEPRLLEHLVRGAGEDDQPDPGEPQARDVGDDLDGLVELNALWPARSMTR